MLKAFFSFRGRTDRRGYVLWSVASIVLPIAAVTAATVLDSVLDRGAQGGATKAMAWIMPGAAVIAFVWTMLALAAKRLRHIGLPPLPVMVGLAAVGITGKLVAPQVSAPLVSALAGASWSYGVPMFLALWPGQAAERSPSQLAETFA